MLELVLAVAVGVTLSACTGLRAFVPLLATAILARAGHYHVQASLEWLSSTPAIIALSVATAVEIAADKVPALDHALDVAQTPVRTVAGALVAMAAFAPLPTWAAALLAIAGGATALAVHATKATVRAGSTAATAGTANPVISIVEDVLCALSSFLAPLFAIVAVVLACVVVAGIFFVARALLRRRKARPTGSAVPSGTP